MRLGSASGASCVSLALRGPMALWEYKYRFSGCFMFGLIGQSSNYEVKKSGPAACFVDLWIEYLEERCT